METIIPSLDKELLRNWQSCSISPKESSRYSVVSAKWCCSAPCLLQRFWSKWTEGPISSEKYRILLLVVAPGSWLDGGSLLLALRKRMSYCSELTSCATESNFTRIILGFKDPIYRFYHDWLESLYLRLITPSPDFSSPSPVSSASELLVWTFGSLDFRCFLAVFEVRFSATTPGDSSSQLLTISSFSSMNVPFLRVATLGAFVKA
ncbi:hypothetical protein Q3G72_010362 [Acer saccharum]|nr:hypothetical protein Q3G72_010362 [Acer saccharum]